MTPRAERGDRASARLAIAAAGVLLTSLLAAGCGSDSDSGGSSGSSSSTSSTSSQGSSAETWATQLCSSVVDWRQSVGSAAATLADTGSLSADKARGAVDDVTTATTTLVSDLQDLGTPDTQAGDEAAAELASLSDAVDQQLTVISKVDLGSSSSLQELLSAASTVTGALATVVQDATTTASELRGLEGADELDSAFQSSSSCEELRSMPPLGG